MWVENSFQRRRRRDGREGPGDRGQESLMAGADTPGATGFVVDWQMAYVERSR